MSQFVVSTPRQCVLEKEDLIEYSENASLLKNQYLDHFKIPFFSFYNYQNCAGNNWMTVYKSNGIDVHYIKQYRTQRRDTEVVGKNTVFLPHLWNTNLTEISGKEFDCNGTFEAFTFDSGVFKQLTFSETHATGANEQDTYDNAKVYTIHAGLNFSDGLKIPEEVMEIVSNKDSSIKLFIKFKWNISTLKQTDLQQPFINPNETFYGIYEFVNVDSAKPMFNTNGFDTDTYEPNFQYDTDFEKQFPKNKVTEADKTEICELMEQFMANVNVSSAAGGGGGGGGAQDDADYLNKGNLGKYNYNRDLTKTNEQSTEDTLIEYNKLASSIVKNKTDLDTKTQNFCNCYITLINLFINFLILPTTSLIASQTNQYSTSMKDLFMYILKNLQPNIEKQFEMNGGGKVTYLNPPQDNKPVRYIGNTKDERDTNKKNVIIVGGGPAGLYMGIILKLMAPELEVIIVEKRIDLQTNERIMGRGENTITIWTKWMLPRGFSIFIEKYDIDNSTLNLYTGINIFLIPTQIKNNLSTNSNYGINGEKLTVNQIEYSLANYAQTIGVLIFHTSESYETYVNPNTICIFDATGGRIDKVKYEFRVDDEKQDIGDGLNINSLNFYGKIPIVCIGDSLFKGNYKTGLGMNTICTMCFYISFLFTLTMGVKEGYVKTYKKFFGKDFPEASVPSAVSSSSNTSSAAGGASVSNTSSAAGGGASSSNTRGTPTYIAVPVSTPGPNPGPTPGPTIVSTSITNPVSNPGPTTVSTPGSTSITNPVSNPGPTTVSTPGSTTVLNPGSNPVSTPGSTPGPTPGPTPVSTTVLNPSSNPVSTPGSTTVLNPSSNPGPTPGSPPLMVAVQTPSTNFMMMPQFGTATEIYIKVIFDGIVPKTVDIVNESSGLTFEDMETYINGLLGGAIQSVGTPVYFKLEKTYAENIVKMIS